MTPDAIHVPSVASTASGFEYAVHFIHRVCELAGPHSFIADIERDLRRQGILSAIKRHDTAKLFDWIMGAVTFQGISDEVASQYMRRHGNVRWADVNVSLGHSPSCSKLAGYWRFHDCRFHKQSRTCAEPEHIDDCPLPRHQLRNGRLNQTAYSLFLFIRDIANQDLVAWIDTQIASVAPTLGPDHLAECRATIIDPLRFVYGVSDKVLAMALCTLMIGARKTKPRWFDVGASFVVVDTLVHNFLHRTGILQRVDAAHPYGPGCYRLGGCADLLRSISAQIDASAFNPTFPRVFPRFVQSAVWRYCAELGLDVCNGNRIDDTGRCDNIYCRLYGRCDRVTLNAKNAKNDAISAA